MVAIEVPRIDLLYQIFQPALGRLMDDSTVVTPGHLCGSVSKECDRTPAIAALKGALTFTEAWPWREHIVYYSDL